MYEIQLQEIFDMYQGVVTSRAKDGVGTPIKVVQTRNLTGLEVGGDVDEMELNLPRKSQRLKKDDILVHLKSFPVRASVVTEKEAKSIAGSNIGVLTPFALPDPGVKLDSIYVAGLLGSRFMERKLTSHMGGESMSSLSLRMLRTLTVPVPPADMQQTMVQAFRRLEKYKRLTGELIEARTEHLDAALDFYFARFL